MMKYTMVVFEYCEQQVKDVLHTIETIKPVVGIIRDAYKTSERLEDIHEEGIEANAKIEAYSELLKLKLNKALTKKLESEIEKLKASVEEGLKEYKELSNYQENLEENLSEYLKYILSFDCLNTHVVAEAISRIHKKDYKSVMAAVLLFTNESIKEEERIEILDYLSNTLDDEELQNVVRTMFFGEEYDTLIEYIGTTDLLNE